MALAFTFPGQGSQSVGMGGPLSQQFSVARDVFDEVDAALDQKLFKLMQDGPIEELTLTENAQPAIMAVSVAAMRVLKQEFGVDVTAAKFVAGHSLGEYSALCAAGALSLTEAAQLLKLRGRSMQAAVPSGQGAMAALLGADMETAAKAVDAGSAHGVVTIANDNAPGQIVISGAKSAVEATLEAAKAGGVKKAIMLSVSAPFHCPLMLPAADVMKEALGEADITDPLVPVVTNVSAAAVSDAATIRDQLVEQVTGKVRWRESVDYMHAQGVDRFAEAGAKVLTPMIKRHIKEAEGIALVTADDLESFANSLKG
ncbi:ACP S-malonyltransferase [Maricaulaceae bacterium MS644]